MAIPSRWISHGRQILESILNENEQVRSANYPFRITFDAKTHQTLDSFNVTLTNQGGLFHLLFDSPYQNSGYIVFVQSDSDTASRTLQRSPSGFVIDPLGENGIWSIFGFGQR